MPPTQTIRSSIQTRSASRRRRLRSTAFSRNCEPHGEIDLAPDFQRKTGIWDKRRQSWLIESLLIRIPLPAFYLDEVSLDHYAVVDGIQRIHTLHSFMPNEGGEGFALEGMQYLTQLEGRQATNLDPPYRRRINEANLFAYIVEAGTPKAAKLNIFRRINTGGMTLSAQEIRHAMSGNTIREMLRELAASDEFVQATEGTVRPDRMDDRDCVARFLAFARFQGQRAYGGRDLDGHILDTMRLANNLGAPQREALASRFVMSLRRPS